MEIHVGIYKSNLISDSAVLAAGDTILQNRNVFKQNAACLFIGDGIAAQPIQDSQNLDSDFIDSTSFDGTSTQFTAQL